MKQIDPNKVYGDVPQSFSHRVDYALRRTREKEEAKPMKRKPLVAVIITVLMIALTTTAVAAGLSKTIEFFVFEYGERVREKMESGTVAPGGQSIQLNDAVFTLADAVVIPDQINWTAESGDLDTPVDTLSFYATGVISVAEEENIVLLACDEYTVNDPAGYALYYPNWPKAPEGAPTYADIARAKAATIRVVNCILTVENGTMTAAMTMSGQGYGYVYMGTRKEAELDTEENYIPFTQDESGGKVFTVPVEALNMELSCAAWSIRKETWYDRTLVFEADLIPAEALIME